MPMRFAALARRCATPAARADTRAGATLALHAAARMRQHTTDMFVAHIGCAML